VFFKPRDCRRIFEEYIRVEDVGFPHHLGVVHNGRNERRT
jgi:hypothetical protein